jgi:hypothetical protein
VSNAMVELVARELDTPENGWQLMRGRINETGIERILAIAQPLIVAATREAVATEIEAQIQQQLDMHQIRRLDLLPLSDKALVEGIRRSARIARGVPMDGKEQQQ